MCFAGTGFKDGWVDFWVEVDSGDFRGSIKKGRGESYEPVFGKEDHVAELALVVVWAPTQCIGSVSGPFLVPYFHVVDSREFQLPRG